LNYLKTNDTSFFLRPENSNDCNTTSITQESDIDKPVKSKRARYLDSPNKETPSDAEDISSNDIHEDMITSEKSLCNAVNNDSCNFEDTIEDRNFGTEDIAEETEKLYSTNSNYNHKIEDKCNLQDSSKSNKNHNDVANIFETYSELDDPIDI